MRPGHGAKREDQRRFFEQWLGMAVGTADQEGDVRHRIVTPAFEATGKCFAVERLAAPVERHQHGARRGGLQQELALAPHHLGRRQLALFFELAKDQRPTDTAGIVLVEVALRTAARAADGGDRDPQALLTAPACGGPAWRSWV